MKLIFATNNKHKLAEIKAIVSEKYQISGLNEAGISEEIPETQDSLEGNAIEKAKYIFDKYSCTCFADDTGLEVQALNNKPGIFSARYAGSDCDSKKNIKKLLLELKHFDNRSARFRTIIAYIKDGELITFEGVVHGAITHQEIGVNGFGYDPVFIPSGFDRTFAEMTLHEKNKISHRSIALQKFVTHLNSVSNI